MDRLPTIPPLNLPPVGTHYLAYQPVPQLPERPNTSKIQNLVPGMRDINLDATIIDTCRCLEADVLGKMSRRWVKAVSINEGRFLINPFLIFNSKSPYAIAVQGESMFVWFADDTGSIVMEVPAELGKRWQRADMFHIMRCSTTLLQTSMRIEARMKRGSKIERYGNGLQKFAATPNMSQVTWEKDTKNAWVRAPSSSVAPTLWYELPPPPPARSTPPISPAENEGQQNVGSSSRGQPSPGYRGRGRGRGRGPWRGR